MSTEYALAFILALGGLAQGGGATAPAPSVEEIRTEVRALLQPMCGTQCDVIDVRLKKQPAVSPGSFAPGFDDTPRPRLVPSEIELTLLFDSKLTAQYRGFVEERVRHRIGEHGIPVLTTAQVKPFPAPPPIPQEQVPVPSPQSAAAQPTPSQPPIVIQAPQPAPSPLPPPIAPNLFDTLMLRIIEALPLFLLFGLLAWVLLRVLKRLDSDSSRSSRSGDRDRHRDRDRDRGEPHLTVTPEILEESRRSPGGEAMPPPTADRLRSDLALHRGSTRRIFRRMLMRGQYDQVAHAVALVGDFVVQDLSHDPALRHALLALGERTAEVLREAMTDEEHSDVLRAIQAELVADRIAHRADDVRKEFEVLLGWGPEAFAEMMRRLVEDRPGMLLLRHAPPHLSESYLVGLGHEARAEAVRRLLSAPPAEPEEIEALSLAVEAHTDAAIVGGYEADHIVDLLDSLPAGEQDALVTDLESTRPDFVRRNLGQLPVESALLRVPSYALESAWATVPLEDWITYLRVAPDGIKERAVAACPARLRDGLIEELRLRVAADPARGAQARRRIIRAALSSAPSAIGATVALTVVEQVESLAASRSRGKG